MNIKSAELKAVRKNGIDIKIHNGFTSMIVSLDKENIVFEDVVNHNVKTKVVVLTRKCCSATPTVVLQSGVKEEDDIEIEDLIEKILKYSKEEIEEKMKNK